MRFPWGPVNGYVYLSQGNIMPGEPASMVSRLRAETVWEASLGLFPRCTATSKHTHSPAYFVHSGATPETPPWPGVAWWYLAPHDPGLTHQARKTTGRLVQCSTCSCFLQSRPVLSANLPGKCMPESADPTRALAKSLPLMSSWVRCLSP